MSKKVIVAFSVTLTLWIFGQCLVDWHRGVLLLIVDWDPSVNGAVVSLMWLFILLSWALRPLPIRVAATRDRHACGYERSALQEWYRCDYADELPEARVVR